MFVLEASLVLMGCLQGTVPVPLDLVQSFAEGQILNGFQRGEVHLRATTQTVSFAWSTSFYYADESQPVDWSLPFDMDHLSLGGWAWRSSNQYVPTRYFPTAACIINDKSLLICGYTNAGKTVIERWVLNWPSPAPAPHINQSTGIGHVPISTPTVGNVTRIYDADIAGQTIVRACCQLRRPNGEPATEVLVVFDDSSDIFRLALGDGSLSVVSLGIAGGPIAPSGVKRIQYGDKADSGFAYRFEPVDPWPFLESPSPTETRLILLDGNRDGTLDGFIKPTSAAYVAGGWHDSLNYNKYWLR